MNSMMAYFEISEENLNHVISDRHIEKISNSSCEKWRSLPPYLEMETIAAKDVDRDHSASDECEKRCSFLKKWKKMKGVKATYKSLICALLEIKCTEEAEGVCKMLKKEEYEQPNTSMSPANQKKSEVKGMYEACWQRM